MQALHPNSPHRLRRFFLGLLLTFALAAQEQTTSFQGSVPTGTVSATPIPLRLEDAIQRGLRTNLGLIERDIGSRTARAERIRALSALLPQVNGSFAYSAQQLNLETLGLGGNSFGPFTVPSIVGPFVYVNALANVSMPIFDWSARKNLKSARANENAAILSTQDARDLVVLAVANAYLL